MAGAAAGATASCLPGGSNPGAAGDHIPPLVRRAGPLDRDEMRALNHDGIDQTLLIWVTLVAVTVAVVLYASAALPAFLWCAAQGQIAALADDHSLASPPSSGRTTDLKCSTTTAAFYFWVLT